MSQVNIVSRRQFLKSTGMVGGAFILGGALPGCSEKAVESGAADVAKAAAKNVISELGYFVSIASDGAVNIICHRMEMGQGILTSVPQMIADELEADWSKVSVTLAKGDPKYGHQSTGGSGSIRNFYDYTRKMGALAKDMLEQAAANRWGVDKSAVKAENHSIVKVGTNEKFGFGELAEDASQLPVPDLDSLELKDKKDFKIIGKDVKLLGQEKIVQGTATYAQDIQVPGMLIASIERPPVIMGKVKSFDATEAKKVAGVVDVIQLRERSLPMNVWPSGGVAVLATNTWAAHQARQKLKIEWDHGANAAHNTEAYKKDLMANVSKKGSVARSAGDVYAHEYDPNKTVEATYFMPYHHHMSMETPAATAYQEGDKWVVWTGTQTPQWGKRMVLEELGLEPEADADKVELNTTLMGGAFGRKGKNDFTIEAVELAKATGKPVKVVWTREDDVKHGFYHATAANYYKAEVSDGGKADNWIQRVSHPQIAWMFNPASEAPDTGAMSQSFADNPFDLKNLSCEAAKTPTHLRIGWLRAVHNIHNAYAMGCFVDELAAKSGISTQQMWLNLLGEDRVIDPTTQGFEGWNNYGNNDEAHALSTARMKNTINYLCEQAGVNEKTADNEGWGISYATSFNSYAAAATKVRVVDNKVEVLEMHTAIDCGVVVTPDRVKSQMEGAMIMGLSIALKSEITVKDGAVEQGNFHDYVVSRINEVPELNVHMVDSQEAPGGVGEPGLPPIVPSIVNAIFHASGIRIRELPVNKTLTIA